MPKSIWMSPILKHQDQNANDLKSPDKIDSIRISAFSRLRIAPMRSCSAAHNGDEVQ